MKYKSLLETNNLHQVPNEHLHAELNNLLASNDHSKKALNTWEWDHLDSDISVHYSPTSRKIYSGLKNMGWESIPGIRRTGSGVAAQFFKHPNGSRLAHGVDFKFRFFPS